MIITDFANVVQTGLVALGGEAVRFSSDTPSTVMDKCPGLPHVRCGTHHLGVTRSLPGFPAAVGVTQDADLYRYVAFVAAQSDSVTAYAVWVERASGIVHSAASGAFSVAGGANAAFDNAAAYWNAVPGFRAAVLLNEASAHVLALSCIEQFRFGQYGAGLNISGVVSVCYDGANARWNATRLARVSELAFSRN